MDGRRAPGRSGGVPRARVRVNGRQTAYTARQRLGSVLATSRPWTPLQAIVASQRGGSGQPVGQGGGRQRVGSGAVNPLGRLAPEQQLNARPVPVRRLAARASLRSDPLPRSPLVPTACAGDSLRHRVHAVDSTSHNMDYVTLPFFAIGKHLIRRRAAGQPGQGGRSGSAIVAARVPVPDRRHRTPASTLPAAESLAPPRLA